MCIYLFLQNVYCYANDDSTQKLRMLKTTLNICDYQCRVVTNIVILLSAAVTNVL